MARTGASRTATATTAVLVLLVAVGLGLRLLRIDLREAWLDEACTALFAGSAGLAELLDALRPESHPPLYYLLLFGWVRLFGTGEVALRLPSVLAGLALVPLVAWAVRRHGGGLLSAGLAALVAAASPLLLYYSLEAKGYTLFWALALAVVALLHRATDPHGETRRAFTAAAVLTVAALYTHHYAFFLLPLWPVAIAAAQRRARWHGALALAAAAVVYAPWGVEFLAGQAAAGGTAWLASFQTDPLTALAGSARVMALAPPFPPYLGELGLVAAPPGAALAVGLWFGAPVALGLLAAALAPGAPIAAPWRTALRRALLPLAALLPPIAAAVLSQWRPLYLVGRYELMAYPAWIALWALGIDRLVRWPGRPWVLAVLRAGAVALTLAGLALVATPYLALPAGPWPHREAARALAAAPPQDAIVVVGLARAPLEHQLRRLDDAHPLASFPPDLAAHPGWFEPERYAAGRLEEEARAVAGELAERPDVWLVTPLDRDPAVTLALFEALRASGRSPGPPQVFGGLGLMRFARP